jgi:APA family basic amino acid/polyamine antiporter
VQVPAAATAVGAITAYQLIYGVYSGWPNPGYFGDESTNPARDIPRGIFGSILGASLVYIGFNAGLVAGTDVSTLAHSDFPAADVVGQVFGGHGTLLVVIIAAVTVFGSANGLILLNPRILYGLGRDGLFFRWAAHVNRGGTPDWAMLTTVAISIALTLMGSFGAVFLLMGAMVLFTMVVTDVAYFVLRYREPELFRPFRAKWHPVLPILLLLIDATLFAAIVWADPFGGIAMVAMVAVAVPISGFIHFLKRRERATVA